MVAETTRKRFEALTNSGDGDPASLAAKTRAGDMTAALDLAALLARVGFVEPALILDTYDAAAAGWAGQSFRPIALTRGSGKAAATLWGPFWDFLDDDTQMDAGSFTMRTARLGDHVDAGFAERAGDASLAYPGVLDAARQGWPEKFQLSDLAACPADSLGGDFHRLIVDNKFDLEVLDRDALGLANMRPPLDYLNARILQCHDLWHIIAGYHTTALHEVAISAFQLSQFGHNYSAQFLAFITARAALKRPESVPLLLEVIFSAWRHGRSSPQLIGVAWPDVWRQPVATIRDQLGISVYTSPFPPDLVEQLQAAGVA
jgi:ubiquinone biosynthesis protein Coq4